MDFFEYASLVSRFTNTFWVQILVGALCFALVFIFQAIALYTIATREGYGKRWMAFVPFFNTYYIGVCAQKNRFYNIDVRKLSLAAAIFEAVLFLLYIVYYAAVLLVIQYEVPIDTINSWGYYSTVYEVIGYPANLEWAAWMYAYMQAYILSTLDLVLIILQICVLICFFQTYSCRRYVIFTITSILFPIQGILFFVVRNNRGVNYRQFMAAQQARQYQAYQQQQQQYYNQNPYNNNAYNPNPYNQNPTGSYSQTKPEDPFADFSGSDNSSNSGGSSPFDDFE